MNSGLWASSFLSKVPGPGTDPGTVPQVQSGRRFRPVPSWAAVQVAPRLPTPTSCPLSLPQTAGLRLGGISAVSPGRFFLQSKRSPQSVGQGRYSGSVWHVSVFRVLATRGVESLVPSAVS